MSNLSIYHELSRSRYSKIYFIGLISIHTLTGEEQPIAFVGGSHAAISEELDLFLTVSAIGSGTYKKSLILKDLW